MKRLQATERDLPSVCGVLVDGSSSVESAECLLKSLRHHKAQWPLGIVIHC